MGGINNDVLHGLGELNQEELNFFMAALKSLHNARISKLTYNTDYRYNISIPSIVEMKFYNGTGSYCITAGIVSTNSEFISDVRSILKMIKVHS